MGFFKDAIDFLTFDMLDLNRSKDKPRQEALDILGQSEADRKALEERKFSVAEGLLAEGKPLREALIQSGLSTLSGLTQFADITQAGMGPQFDIPLQRGTEALFRNLAPFGLTDSSVAGRGVGELTSGLLGQDIQRRIGVGQSLLGLAPTSTAPGVGLLGGISGTSPLAGDISRLTAQQPQGPLADIGDFIFQLGGRALGAQTGGLFGGTADTTTSRIGQSGFRGKLLSTF